ncbi:MAG: diaminopimelate decarboxylase [Candidatus Margulisiibacteriota bacterium]|nr:MAG: diaminopimelate decarboxylase [Candidatus Margulisbacteria bacterium GWD2_39_127]OGI04299.1 MAG: diaminopimelate decarboxylase [Candidatus Margulisbacteria bacterium GWF2_38_17]OGI11796.1 MAG: diaminopimelate decarboxylase [Candidatus Margulisbacteria bacterium GWE2_39_32]PZM79833.1 MAG: diaminopimelate decarboxylase [Candidatus Margulisiibacteriota bacterium]HAR62742.1 diaminopimelate decarboxylase [Candidatus Margulisiibacteriota bacterium]
MGNRPVTTKIDEKGHLEIGGCDLSELVKKYQSPLWVLDKETILNFCNRYKTSFSKYYDNFLPLFASKALCTIATTQIIDKEGFGFDVVSGGELYTVLRAGVNPEKIYFHGNNKAVDELELAIESNVGRIVVDNTYELERIEQIAAAKNKTVSILFRITPEVDAHTHEFIQTGQLDSKFGVNKPQVVSVIRQALTCKHISIVGIHAHIGSQIFDVEPFEVATKKLCELALDIRNNCGLSLQEINVGGGLGIKYLKEDDPSDIELFAETICKTLQQFCIEYAYPLPKLIIEPGRSTIANAGITLYTIGSVKDIPGIRTYIAIDGGMADNPRPLMYDAKYEAVIANKASLSGTNTYTIAGKFCESGDIIIKNILLPKVEIGDIICIFTTGAYNYSMSSNYNRFRKPAMVLLDNGNCTEILKRETYEDIIRNDIYLSKE